MISCYQDNNKLEGSLKQMKVNGKQQLSVTIPKNGGLVITE